jgi:hypothetical protein
MNGGSELATLEPANESSTRPRELSAKDLRFEAKIAGKFASTRDLSGAENSSARNARSLLWNWC